MWASNLHDFDTPSVEGFESGLNIAKTMAVN